MLRDSAGCFHHLRLNHGHSSGAACISSSSLKQSEFTSRNDGHFGHFLFSQGHSRDLSERHQNIKSNPRRDETHQGTRPPSTDRSIIRPTAMSLFCPPLGVYFSHLNTRVRLARLLLTSTRTMSELLTSTASHHHEPRAHPAVKQSDELVDLSFASSPTSNDSC